MSFVDVQTSTHVRKRVDLFDDSQGQSVEQKKEIREIVEKPNLVSFFPVSWMPAGHTEYLIISDSDTSDLEDTGDFCDSKKDKSVDKNKMDADDEEFNNSYDPKTTSNTIKNEPSFRDKISNVTKDIGNFFSNPSANIREFLRRREGYMPPDKRLIQDNASNDN